MALVRRDEPATRQLSGEGSHLTPGITLSRYTYKQRMAFLRGPIVCSTFSARPLLLSVSKEDVRKTTGKDNSMPPFIPMSVLLVFFVCALWFHDVWFPPEGRGYKKKRNPGF